MKISQTLRAASALAGVALFVPAAFAQTALSGVAPLAVAPGKTTELTLTGSGLTPPFSLWTSFASQVEFPSDGDNAVDANPKKVKVTLAPEAAVGIGAIAMGTAGGASEPFLILIDDLSTAVEQDSNRAAASAQAIAAPVAVDGASQAGASDFYRITAAAGQRVAFEVYAARIGSPLDAVMWLRDAAGNELAYADDDASAGADCRFAHTFAAAGDYTLEIRDNRYQGGHRYRLRIGDFPLVSSTWPLSARSGTTTSVAFAEGAGHPPSAASQFVIASADDPQAASQRAMGIQRLNVRGPTSNAAGLSSLSIGDLYEVVEVEPNDAAAQASSVSAPCAINGRFEVAGDKDHYRFVAKKGERLVFKSTSRRSGSPATVALRVLRADGMAAAEAPAPGEDDSLLSFSAPDDGEYLLQVEEVQSLAGPERVYRVEIERPLGFRLDFKAVAPGRDRYAAQGAFAVDLVSVRDGYDGPIVISAQAVSGGAVAGESLAAYNNVIPAGQNEIKAIFVTGADWSGGQVRPIRIFGAREDGSSRQAARSTALLRARWPQQAFPPSWLDGLGYVGVLAKAPELYVLKMPVEAPPLAAATTESAFVVAPERKDGNFKEVLSIFLTNLPAGATYAVTREGDPPADKYTVKLTCPAGLAAGDYRIRSFAYGELNGVGQVATGEFLLHKAAP